MYDVSKTMPNKVIYASGQIPQNIESWINKKSSIGGHYKLTNGTCCIYGLFVFITLIAIILTATLCCNHNSHFTNFTEPFSQRLGGLYTDIAPTLPQGNRRIDQPGVFKKQVKVGPGNCMPYSGCFYPSFMSNPVSLKTGRRLNEPRENEIWCEEAWRDCNAYQDCVNNKCTPKGYPKQ